jgi:hypothetical protein|tara:strand:- start:87 stop:581 length:495 start_codon:yes stop_codon:yes gene_type:complete
MKTKNLFKVNFKSGKTYYGLSSVKSTESFVKTHTNLAKFHLENPHIHTITNFETLLLNENFECSFIKGGSLEEIAKLKDSLVESDKMSINYKKSVIEKKKAEKNPLTLIKKEFIKNVKNSKGEVLTFIEKTTGIKKGLSEGMKFSQTHPLNQNFCLITQSVSVI